MKMKPEKKTKLGADLMHLANEVNRLRENLDAHIQTGNDNLRKSNKNILAFFERLEEKIRAHEKTIAGYYEDNHQAQDKLDNSIREQAKTMAGYYAFNKQTQDKLDKLMFDHVNCFKGITEQQTKFKKALQELIEAKEGLAQGSRAMLDLIESLQNRVFAMETSLFEYTSRTLFSKVKRLFWL